MPRSTNPPRWKAGPFHKFMLETFPEHRTPFKRLDVARIADDTGKSYESVYKWLRKGRVNVENAKLLCDAANMSVNVEALERVGREPPRIEHFMPFFLA